MISFQAVRFSRRLILGLGGAVLLALSVPDIRAEPSTEAVAAMTIWLKGFDAGQYAQSWQVASPAFQKAEPAKSWENAMAAKRLPLGACLDRKLISAFYQGEVTTVGGTTLDGYFVVAKYLSNFANFQGLDETVTFAQTGAVWQASGYDVKEKNSGGFQGN